MSIINQMLRDLDARHASANERAGLPTGLRTLPPEPASRPKTWLLLAAGLIVGALIAWFFVSQQASTPVMPQAVTPVAQPQPVPPPAPMTAPEAPAPVPVPAPVPAPKPAPAPAPAVVPVTKPPAPVAAAPVAAPVEKPMKAVAPPPVAAAPMGAGQIDKQPKSGGLPRELAETEYRKGMQAAGIGDNATAIPALRRALDIDPKHIKARQALLSVLASSRQWDEVKQVAQSGLALDPARTGWASILARLQHEQGDTEGAVKTLESHAAYAAGDADFQGLFAFLLQKRQRYADAVQHYQAALALRPGEGRWWFGLGLAFDAAGRGDEAKAAFGKAREAGNLSTDMLGIIEQKLK
jgi:MSHA biogenesis protein MshN